MEESHIKEYHEAKEKAKQTNESESRFGSSSDMEALKKGLKVNQ